MKLFALYIGGKTANSLIEVHDVRFTIGKRLQDTYPEIRKSWWGTPQSLHLDCWGELTSADGYNITLSPEPCKSDEKLWFVNLGGYEPGDFNEQHKNIFVVAPTESQAQVRALKTITHWQGRHRDTIFEVEHILCLDEIAAEKGLSIHLEKTDNLVPFEFKYGYKPIGKESP